jgi:predicted ATP-grasp superfamily ATP-dependent carboligase
MSAPPVKGVLVTGVGAPPGLAVLRSLQESGLDLKLAAADISPFAGGLHGMGVPAVVLPRAADADSYLMAVRQACEHHGLDVVIPCSEAEVAALAPARQQFEAEYGIRVPIAAPEVIAFGIDKGLLLERVRERGLPAPGTLYPDCADDVEAWSAGFPCVVKPRSARGARGVSYPASMEELRETWPRTVGDHGASLIQQFIPGGPDTVYTIGALFDEGRLIASTLHRKLASNPPSGGAATAGETVRDPGLMRAGLAIFEASGPWHGLTAVELKRPAPDKPAYLLEINPRMWGFGYLMTMAGLNMPALLIRMLNGEFAGGRRPDADYGEARMVRAWRDVAMEPELCP